MGSIISAFCDCGYEKPEMFLGGGMSNFTTYCNFPHYCEDCHTLFEFNLFEKNILCPECGSKKVFGYDHKKACKEEGNVVFSWNVGNEIDRELKLTDGKYICPRCKKFNLSFCKIGNWD